MDAKKLSDMLCAAAEGNPPGNERCPFGILKKAVDGRVEQVNTVLGKWQRGVNIAHDHYHTKEWYEALGATHALHEVTGELASNLVELVAEISLVAALCYSLVSFAALKNDKREEFKGEDCAKG